MTVVLDRPVAPVTTMRAEKRRVRLVWIARHSIAIAIAIMFLTPVVYLVLLSLMTSDQALTSDYWPNTWHPENYLKVFQSTPLPLLKLI